MSDISDLSDFSLLSTSRSSISSTENTDSSLTETKTKVDRKILNAMLTGGNQTLESADDFFVRVANESGAVIAYPRQEKLQQIGRREPEIRLFGNGRQVEMARNLILSVMGPYKNRVTLKVEVSYFDHSHIIGKGGKRISNIMAMTDTHIHFPDCNRIECEAKSNQVTIAGNSLTRAEEARRLIRDNMPLTISFNLEVNERNIELLNPSDPNILFYQKRYNILVNFKITEPTIPNCHSVTVQVRGTRLQYEDLREAVRSIFTHLNGSIVGFNTMVVTIEMDISPQHHAFVMGRGNHNLRAINSHSGAIVTFPEATVSSSLQHDINRSRVVIKGRGIDSAYLAWLELIGYLPLVMIFSLPSEKYVDSKLFQDLMVQNELIISIRQKMENGIKLVVLKTQERKAHLLFDARQKILGIKESLPVWPLSVTQTKTHTLNTFSLSDCLPNRFNQYETECLRAFRIN